MYGTDGINLNNPPESGSAGWDEQTGKGYVDLGSLTLNGPVNENSIRMGHRWLALVFLHEIIHTATKGRNPFSRFGGYEDVELAQAVFFITKDPKDNIDNIPPGSTMSPVGRGGIIWDRALRKYCK
jgi:hypothetical protein